MTTITATLINLYHVCHRELWLHANEVRMEQTSAAVADGKFIGDTTYQQRPGHFRQVELPGAKIDFYDHKAGVVHETKRSDKMARAHIAQVKYYLYLLTQHGVPANYGIIEYPAQRHRERVELGPGDPAEIERWMADIRDIIGRKACPPVINKPFCRNCSYHDFCYVE